MSSLLWGISILKGYCYSNQPETELPLLIETTRIGNYSTIINELKAWYYSGSFHRVKVNKNPAKWGAYFVFIGRETSVKLEQPEELFLMELLESVDPKVWVQNRDVVSLLLESLIKYSARL